MVATVYEPGPERNGAVGFENHLNIYHRNDRGLPVAMAHGLAVFLNSTLVDLYFRQFSGHTQVNATDLRSLRYPSATALEKLGHAAAAEAAAGRRLDQDAIDELIFEELNQMAGSNPVKAKKKIEEGIKVLKALGLPKAQQNERCSLTLLALADLRPEPPWSKAHAPLRGSTEMMVFFAEHYGKQYAPNTRETVRRQTVHQFEQAGLVLRNPDDSKRPVNSPKTVYKLSPDALRAIRTFGTSRWAIERQAFISTVKTLIEQYGYKRKIARIPVQLGERELTLSPGGQNDLIKQVIEEFCPRFTPGGHILYIGDADDKWALNEADEFMKLGLKLDAHGKMPDVVIYYHEKDWLVLVEAVTSHGPMDPKRHNELKKLFKKSKAGLIFVTAFAARGMLNKFLTEIAWETEVWIAESPDHLIHFDGERFLGPYAER